MRMRSLMHVRGHRGRLRLHEPERYGSPRIHYDDDGVPLLDDDRFVYRHVYRYVFRHAFRHAFIHVCMACV